MEFHIELWDYLNDPILEKYDSISLLALQPGKHTIRSLSTESGNVAGVKDEWKQVSFLSFQSVPVVFCTSV